MGLRVAGLESMPGRREAEPRSSRRAGMSNIARDTEQSSATGPYKTLHFARFLLYWTPEGVQPAVSCANPIDAQLTVLA